MNHELEYQKNTRYSTLTQTPDLAATYLTLDAIAKFPQLRYGSTYLIAHHLLNGIGKKGWLTIVQADQAHIDPSVAWEFTKIIHKTYRVGTNRPQFRNPNNPDSPQIYPKNPAWLAQFVKDFLEEAIDLIRDKIRDELYGPGRYVPQPDGGVSSKPLEQQIERKLKTALQIQTLLEKDSSLRMAVLNSLKPTLDDVNLVAKSRRDNISSESEEKFGPGGVQYD